MAETKGFTRDHPECNQFQAAPLGGKLPAGWVRVWPSAEVPRANGEEVGRPSTRATQPESKFEFCSNCCLALFALERAKAAGERTPGIYTREPKKRKS